MKNTYKILIKFKNNPPIEFFIESEVNLKNAIRENWALNKREGAVCIGDYIFSTEEILWIKVEGEAIAESSGE